MHMLGEPRTMQDDPRYDDVVADVKAFLEERLAFAVAAGIAEDRIWLDPGIGFGKTVDHNLDAAAAPGRARRDRPPGRRRHLAQGVPRQAHAARRRRRAPAGTIATNVLALERGAAVFRVHDVAPVADALARGGCYVAAAMDGDDD